MLWKHLWNCACWRGRLEDWQDKDIPEGAASTFWYTVVSDGCLWKNINIQFGSNLLSVSLLLSLRTSTTPSSNWSGLKRYMRKLFWSRKFWEATDTGAVRCKNLSYVLMMSIWRLYDLCFLKERIPKKKRSRSCHSETLERTQRKKAVQSGESLFKISVLIKVKIQLWLAK